MQTTLKTGKLDEEERIEWERRVGMVFGSTDTENHGLKGSRIDTLPDELFWPDKFYYILYCVAVVIGPEVIPLGLRFALNLSGGG